MEFNGCFFTGYLLENYRKGADKLPLRAKFFKIDKVTPRESKLNPSKNEVRKEIVIQTNSFENAIKAQKLIFYASILDCAHYPVNGINYGPPRIYPCCNKVVISKENYEYLGLWEEKTELWDSISEWVELACRLSYRKKYQYAIYKYYLGCYLHSNVPKHLNPYENYNLKLPKFEDDQIRMGLAIVSYYSVIEELGFDLGASKDNPSYIKGAPNPKLYSALYKKILKCGVKRVDFNFRGPITSIEKYLKGRGRMGTYKKSRYAKSNVRDGSVDLYEAIAIISNIRSSVVAHKTYGKPIKSLSVYDVSNANHLARTLLLDALRNS